MHLKPCWVGFDTHLSALKMAQFTMQMRAVTNLESCGQAVAASRENGFGKVGIAAAASRLASGSQGWRPAAVTHLRVAAARHVTFQRQCDLLLGIEPWMIVLFT